MLLFVALYLATFALVLSVARGREAGWLVIAAILAVLTVEKFVEPRMGAIASDFALSGGWYHHRRSVQVVVILAILVTAIASVLLAFRSHRATTRAALLVVIALAGFALVRGVSLHEVHAVLAAGIGPVRLRHMIELGLLGAIAALAFKERASPYKRARSI
jgi:hypothetical protein